MSGAEVVWRSSPVLVEFPGAVGAALVSALKALHRLAVASSSLHNHFGLKGLLDLKHPARLLTVHRCVSWHFLLARPRFKSCQSSGDIMAEAMAVDEGHSNLPNPGHTIYCNNLPEKISQDGERAAKAFWPAAECRSRYRRRSAVSAAGEWDPSLSCAGASARFSAPLGPPPFIECPCDCSSSTHSLLLSAARHRSPHALYATMLAWLASTPCFASPLRPADLKKAMRAIFGQFGPIMDVVSRRTYRLRGQAWVVFEKAEDAKRALEIMQGFPFKDKPMVGATLLHNHSP